MSGIELFDADDGRNGNTIRNNTINDNELGVSLIAGAQNSRHRGQQDPRQPRRGVFIQFSSGHLIEDNEIVGIPTDPHLDSDGGVLLDDSHRQRLHRTTCPRHRRRRLRHHAGLERQPRRGQHDVPQRRRRRVRPGLRPQPGHRHHRPPGVGRRRRPQQRQRHRRPRQRPALQPERRRDGRLEQPRDRGQRRLGLAAGRLRDRQRRQHRRPRQRRQPDRRRRHLARGRGRSTRSASRSAAASSRATPPTRTSRPASRRRRRRAPDPRQQGLQQRRHRHLPAERQPSTAAATWPPATAANRRGCDPSSASASSARPARACRRSRALGPRRRPRRRIDVGPGATRPAQHVGDLHLQRHDLRDDGSPGTP